MSEHTTTIAAVARPSPIDLTPLEALRPSPFPWRRTTLLLLLWTAVVAGSGAWHWHRIAQSQIEQTLTKARAVADELLFYQRQEAATGEYSGIIPLLEQRRLYHPQRDEARAELLPLPGVDGAVADRPDLRKLQGGVGELHSHFEQYGRRFMQLVVPVTVTQECMSCHVARGYQLGAVTGALAVTVPARSGAAGGSTDYWILLLVHSGLWSIGLIALLRRGATESYRVYQSDLLEQRLREVFVDCQDTADDLSARLSRTNQALDSETDARLKQRERLHLVTQALQQTPVGIIVLDRLGHIEYVNPKVSELTGYSPDELLSREIMVFQPKDMDAEPFEQLVEALKLGRHWQGELAMLRKDQHTITVSKSLFPLEGGVSLYSIIVFTPNDTVDFSKHTLRQLAYIDPVTHLPNRREFRRFMTAKTVAVDEGTEKGFALVYLDVDGFGAINDEEGPEFGDILLKIIGQRLHHSIRGKDMVARLDADLFGVLLTDVSSANTIATIISKMRDALDKPVILEGRNLAITASIGVSVYAQDAVVVDQLEKYADVALFRARRLGTQAIQFYAQSVEASSADRIAVRVSLEQALEQDRFDLEYMPMRPVGGKDIDGLEVLLRLDHPAFGRLPPESFLQVAEDTGLIIPMGVWVIHHAINEIRALEQQGGERPPLYFNLSRSQLQRPNLIFDLDHVALEKNIELSTLGVEFREEALNQDNRKVIVDNLKQLRDRGIQVTLDRFGSGMFSLRYLSDLPLTGVKIDRSFIHASVSDPSGERIIAAIINLAKSLSLETIAVGVETEEQEQLLLQHGCDRLQGGIVASPQGVDALSAMLLRG